ncbi:FKBP-type peptidyl-prolyl cis-trans isomerase [Candidatus Dependentiae bacterium]|nr:FKBP-type peptidyl-prolyl cis-trans isomerase [Candidatus Dependentiae bacterium]
MSKKITVYHVIFFLGIAAVVSSIAISSFNENKNDAVQGPQEEEIASSKEVALPSGLRYSIPIPGKGDRVAQRGDTAVVHYVGWLDEDGKPGKQFDSSVERGVPFSFIVGAGQVIKGWDEGVVGMKIGEKRRLTIPSHLGYGSAGAPGSIPPNATLIFDVALLSLSKK